MFARILHFVAERARCCWQRYPAWIVHTHRRGVRRARWRGRFVAGLSASVLALAASVAEAAERVYPLEVLPPEYRRMTDPQTGVELLFLTTAPETDANLYFHEYSWLADESVILFTSARAKGGLMGYITATGELIRFHTPQGSLGGATAAARGNSLFALRGRNVVEIKLAMELSGKPAVKPSRAVATERVLCTLPDGAPSSSLNPNCDGKYLSLGVSGFADRARGPTIYKIAIRSGKLSEVCRLPLVPGYGAHVQWSRTNPNLISFAGGRGPTKDFAGPVPPATSPEDYAGRGGRLWVVDIREGVPRNVYLAAEGELNGLKRGRWDGWDRWGGWGDLSAPRWGSFKDRGARGLEPCGDGVEVPGDGGQQQSHEDAHGEGQQVGAPHPALNIAADQPADDLLLDH
jgi:hypothetical protein